MAAGGCCGTRSRAPRRQRPHCVPVPDEELGRAAVPRPGVAGVRAPRMHQRSDRPVSAHTGRPSRLQRPIHRPPGYSELFSHLPLGDFLVAYRWRTWPQTSKVATFHDGQWPHFQLALLALFSVGFNSCPLCAASSGLPDLLFGTHTSVQASSRRSGQCAAPSSNCHPLHWMEQLPRAHRFRTGVKYGSRGLTLSTAVQHVDKKNAPLLRNELLCLVTWRAPIEKVGPPWFRDVAGERG